MSENRPQAIIEVKQLKKSVGVVNSTANDELIILQQVDVVIHAGETVAIVGPSGSGKSTLLGLMAGLDVVTEGQIIISGRDLTDMNEDQRAELRAKYVGFVFQSFQLIQSLTALENVMLPLELNRITSARQKAVEILGRVGLENRMQHYPAQLSGGEQQRVAIARAFVSSPAILFADEPTGNLDKRTAKQIIDLLFEINHEKHTTLVLVTHDSDLAERCQKQYLLEDGKIIQ